MTSQDASNRRRYSSDPVDALLRLNLKSLSSNVVLEYAGKVEKLHISRKLPQEKLYLLSIAIQKLLQWLLIKYEACDQVLTELEMEINAIDFINDKSKQGRDIYMCKNTQTCTPIRHRIQREIAEMWSPKKKVLQPMKTPPEYRIKHYEIIHQAIITIQRYVRGYYTRQHFYRMLRNILQL